MRERSEWRVQNLEESFFKNRGKAFTAGKNERHFYETGGVSGLYFVEWRLKMGGWEGGFFIRRSRWIDKTRAFQALPLSRHAPTLFVFVGE